ncbi:hypothetical protein [Polyangium sp. y55x31]|uniref:hypothetical protein n=1 Tax=Polyangium sp. y55x31 TaxID=3042688 RepID=UPI00248312B2|nr:hypothetical protein [Polyangium sp. y55x31]MDI1484401.1 hypothetical protein [Polyangium sp. y55x31]
MSRGHLVFAGALVFALAGCINEDTRLYEIELDGQVAVPNGAPSTGAVHLEFHVAQTFGEGDLAHPLGVFETRTVAGVGPVRETVLYPLDEGDGLVVYGWLDRDGDGVLCAPGQTEEPAGLVKLAGFPAHTLSFSLSLGTPCVGPESLYP